MKKYVHGGDIYRHPGVLDFSANINPLGTPDNVIQAAAKSLEQICHYPDAQQTKLKEALAEYEQVPEEWLICGNGAAELIFALVQALHPKKALLPAPTFAEYEQALRGIGCEITYEVLRRDRGFVPEESILEKITEELDLLFLCNPNNPTGVLAEPDLMKKICLKCKEMGTWLVIDECFLDFVKEPELHTMKKMLWEYDRLFILKAKKICLKCKEMGTWLVIDECFLDFVKEPELHTMKKMLWEYDRLFILKAFTKRYAMAGLRLGYGITSSEKLLNRMEEGVQPWNVSTPAQEAGIAALKEEEYVQRARALIFQEKDFLMTELRNFGYTVCDSQANYIFFHGEENLKEKLMKENIMIRDCSNYPGLKKGDFRIAVRTHEENCRLVEAIRKGREQ